MIRKHNTKSTQTVYNDFSKASKSSIASKLQEETAEAELFKHHPSPHLLSQPFLGYIRKHEKIYARELGLMKIAMREFHQFYDSMAAEVSRLFQSRPVLDSRSYDEWSLKLGDLQQKFDESSWLFDPNFFIKKVAQGTNNPIDVAAQARMLQSYREAAHDATTVNPKGEEVVNGLTDLIADLESRIKEKGGWRAVLFTAEGTVDLDLDVTPWRAEEQVEILQEKLNYMQYKFKLKENELKQTTESLRASIVNEPRDEKSKLLTDADDSLSCSGVEGSIPHQTDHKSVESAAKSGADRPKPESHNSNSKKYNKLKMISSELGKKARISKMLKVKKNESVPVFNAILSDSIDSEKDNDRINSIARMHLNNVSDSNNYTMCIAESDKPTDVVEQASEDGSINLLPSHTEDDEHSSLENRREHEIQILRENIRDLTEIVWDAVHKLSVLLKTGLPIVTNFITHAIDVGTTVPENLRLTNSLVAADNIEEPRFLAATSKEATKAAGEREFIKTSSKLSNNGSVQNISMQKLPNTSFSPTGGKSFIDRSVHPGWRQFEQVLRRDHANQKEDIVSSLLQQSDISLVGNSVTLENSTFNYANTNERRDSVVEISIPLISTPHPPSHEVLPGILRQNGTVHESYVDRMDIESLKQTTDNAGQNLQQICHYVEKHFNSLLSSCVVHHPARSNNSSTDRLRELSVSTTKQAACTRPKTANNSFASSNKISSETTPKALLKLKKHIENSQQALKIYNSGSDHFRDTLTEKPLTIPISSGKIPRFDNK